MARSLAGRVGRVAMAMLVVVAIAGGSARPVSRVYAQVTPVVTVDFDQGPFNATVGTPSQLGVNNLHVRISTNVPIRGVSFGIAYNPQVVKIGTALNTATSIAQVGSLG